MTYSTVFKNQRVVRDVHAYENNIRTKVGQEEVVFNVALDSDRLAEMASRAARNKSQQCKDGALLIEVVSRRRL